MIFVAQMIIRQNLFFTFSLLDSFRIFHINFLLFIYCLCFFGWVHNKSWICWVRLEHLSLLYEYLSLLLCYHVFLNQIHCLIDTQVKKFNLRVFILDYQIILNLFLKLALLVFDCVHFQFVKFLKFFNLLGRHEGHFGIEDYPKLRKFDRGHLILVYDEVLVLERKVSESYLEF